ncbi:MAG: DUF2309 family protein, partial [Chitinophagaceae bacterium]|nr:DUF2309 family protein [Chitinophagaceae bacterium]
MSQTSFDESHILHELRHYLPTQTPLKDFIHHNSLHAFQHMKFYDAIFKASKIFGFQVTLQLAEFRQLHEIRRIKDEVLDRIIINSTGKDSLSTWRGKLLSQPYDDHNSPRIGVLRSHWKSAFKIDLDNLVQPLLFRIFASYLDEGIAINPFPASEAGFLASIKQIEKNNFISFFKTSRARKLLLETECTIASLLKLIVGDEKMYSQYLFDQQFSHRGWSGMVCAIEANPNALLDAKYIALRDAIIFELILEIDALDHQLGKKWQPLATVVKSDLPDLFAPVPSTELNEVLTIWQNAFEWSYYDEVLNGMKLLRKRATTLTRTKKSFQAMFCIDERECSLRRHIESIDPNCETLGTPGFFSVEFFLKPEGGSFYDKLCPAPVT